MAVPAPTIIQRPAHPNNYAVGRVGGRNGQFTFHHVVGSAESAAQVFQNPGRLASSTYTVTDIPGVVFQHVHINNTPYTDGNGASNSRSITCEHHGDWRFGYRNETVIQNSAMLIAWLRDQGLITHYHRHREVSMIATTCSADLPVQEIWDRATAIINASKGKPSTSVPSPASITWTKFPKPVDYVLTKDTNLWNFGAFTWGNVVGVAKHKAGERVTIYGKAYNKSLNATYLVTEFSFGKKITNGFNQADMKVAPPAKAKITSNRLPKPTDYVLNKDAVLWDFSGDEWPEIKEVKRFKKGDRITIFGIARNHSIGADYYQTEYSYMATNHQGFNKADLALYVPPAKPVVPAKPEWEKNLKPITPVKLTVLGEQTPLVNLVTLKPLKQLGAGTVIDFVKTTTVGGKEYLISSYSASNGAASGVLRSAVGIPTVPPKNEKPAWLEKWDDIEDVDMYARADTDLVDLTTGDTIKTIARGEKVRVASTTEWFGKAYAITEYSTSKKEGRGILIDDLDVKRTPPVEPAPEQPTIQVDRKWLEGIGSTIGKLLGKK